MMGNWFGYAPWGWLGMGLTVLFWIAVVTLLVWALSTLATRPAPADGSALAILRQRYARGEISQAEFEQATQAIG
ncbi:MAG: SHOCT domain-containing protein [Chloroflexi bacterium]|nr:SHOCT domain-containing protein [Chloroflexota bacterium]